VAAHDGGAAVELPLTGRLGLARAGAERAQSRAAGGAGWQHTTEVTSTEATVLVELAQRALVIALCVALPVLSASVAVGLLISAAQAALRQSDTTLTVAPRLLAAGGMLLIFGGWMVTVLGGFWGELWRHLPEIVR